MVWPVGVVNLEFNTAELIRKLDIVSLFLGVSI
jgi:hypothetical protein